MSSPSSDASGSAPSEATGYRAPVFAGQRFMVVLILIMLTIAGLAIWGLRSSQHRRFAVSLSSIPPSTVPGIVALDKPLLLRVDHSSPLSRSLVSLAILLDADGNPLSDIVPLQAAPGPKGVPIQQVEFPPLGKLPVRGRVSGLVMRVENSSPETIAKLKDALELDKVKSHQLARVFTRTIVTCRELGGHAEQSQREVK